LIKTLCEPIWFCIW